MSQNPFSDTGNVEILIDLKQKGISDAVENLKKLHDSGQLIGKDFEQAIKTVNDLSRALNRLAKDYKEVKSIAGNFDFSNFFSAATKQAAARAEIALSVPANLLSQELARFNPGISPRALERQIKQARSERGALDRLTPGSDFGQQAQLQAQAEREARNYELQQRGRRPYQDLYPRSALTTQGNLLPPVSHLPMTGRVLSPAGLGRGGDYLSPQEIELQRHMQMRDQLLGYVNEQMDQINNQLKIEGQNLKNQAVTATQKRIGSYVDPISHTRATPQAQVTEAAARRMGIQLSTLGRFSRLASDFDTNPVEFVQAYKQALGEVYRREKRTAGSADEMALLAMSKVVRGWQEPGFPSYGGRTAGNRQESIEGKLRLGRIQIALAQVLEERRQSGFSGMTAADAASQGEGRLKEFLQFHSVMSGSELRKYAALGGSNPQGRGGGESEILSSRAQLMAQVFSRARVNPTTRARSMYAGELETILGRDPDVHGLWPNDIDAAEAQTRLNELAKVRNAKRIADRVRQLTSGGAQTSFVSLEEAIAARRKRSNEAGFISMDMLLGESFFGIPLNRRIAANEATRRKAVEGLSGPLHKNFPGAWFQADALADALSANPNLSSLDLASIANKISGDVAPGAIVAGKQSGLGRRSNQSGFISRDLLFGPRAPFNSGSDERNQFYLDYIDKIVAPQSPDPSLKVGALVVDADQILSSGYNRLPEGMENTHARMQRPLKYAVIKHAEEVALQQAAGQTAGKTMVSNWTPCDACARKIIDAGIKNVVVKNFATLPRWEEAHNKAKQMFEDAGVSFTVQKPNFNEVARLAAGPSSPEDRASRAEYELKAARLIKKQRGEAGFISGGNSIFGLNRDNVSEFFSSLFGTSSAAVPTINPKVQAFRQRLNDKVDIARQRQTEDYASSVASVGAFSQKLDDKYRLAQQRQLQQKEIDVARLGAVFGDAKKTAKEEVRIRERGLKLQARTDAIEDAGEFFRYGGITGSTPERLAAARLAAGGRTAAGLSEPQAQRARARVNSAEDAREFFETGTLANGDLARIAQASLATGGRTAASIAAQSKSSGPGRSLSSFSSLYAIGIAEGAAISATDVFYNATKYAARTQEMELVTRNMAQAAGLSGLAVQQTVQAVQRNFVTAQEAHKTIERLMFSQIDLAKAPALARMAQDVAVIKGVDPSEALDRITQGITSGYTRSLHMMGIMVNSQDIMREEKTKLGRTPNEYERRQAIADKVLSEGVKVSGNFEASLLTASRQSALLGVQAADVMNTVGNEFIPVYSNLMNKVADVLQGSKNHPAISHALGSISGGAVAGLGVLGGGATLGYLLSGLGATAATVASVGSVILPIAAATGIATSLYLGRDQVGLTTGNIEDRLLSYDRRTSEEAAARQTAASRLGVSIPSDVVRFGPVGISRSLAERSQTTSRVLQGGTAELAKRIREASDPSWWQYPSTFLQNLTGVENNAATYLDPNTGLLRPVTGAAVAGYTYAGRRLFPSQFNVGGRVITADAINEQLSQQRQFEALVQIDPTQAYINQYKMIPDQLRRQNEEQLAHQAALTGKKLEMFAERTARQAARGGQAGPLGQMSAEFAERMEEFATTEIPSGVKDEQGHDVMVPTSMMDKMKRTPGYLAAQKAEGQRQSAYATLQRAHLAAKEVQGQQAIGLAQLRLSVLPGDFAGERSLIDSEYTQRIANIQPYLSAFGSTLSAGDRRIQTDHMTAEARMEFQKSGATLQESQVQENRRDFTKRQQLAGGVALNELNFSPLGEQQKINEQYKIRMQVAENIGTIASKELQRELELTAAAERTNSRFAVRAAIVAHQFGLESTETIGRLSFDTNRTIGLSSINSPLIREMQSLQNIRTGRSGQLLENQAQFGIDSRNPTIGPDVAARNLTAANLKTNLGFDQNLFNAEIQSVQSLRSRLAEMYTMRLNFEEKIRGVQNDGATSQVQSLDRNYEQTLALIEKKRLLYGGGAEANLTAAEAQTQASLQYKENVTKIKQQNLADTEDIAGQIFEASRSSKTKSGLSGEGIKVWGQKQLDELEKQVVSNLAGMVFGDLPSKLGSIFQGQSDPTTGKKTGLGRLLKGTRFEERAEPKDLAKADATLKSAMSTTEQIQKQMEQDLRDILAALTGTNPATSGSAIGNLQSLSSANLADSTKAFLSLSNGLPQISGGSSAYPAASILSPRLNTTRNGPVMYFSNGPSSSMLGAYNGAGSASDYMPSVVTSFGGNPNIAGGNGYISADGTYSDYPSEGPVPISGGGGGGVPGGANPAGMGMGTTSPAAIASKSASSLSLFAKGLGRPSDVWEAVGLNNSGNSSSNGLSTAQAVGSMVSAVGVVAAGVHEVTQSLKSAGAKGYFGAAGGAAGTAAALDPEPISKTILAGIALGSKLIASILPDTRVERAKLISDTLGQNTYLAPVAINASMDLNGMATDFDSHGNLRSSNYTTFAQAPTEPYHYQSPINQQWYNIPGYNPGPFQPRQPTGPYPRNPPATPGVPVGGSAGPSVIHQHFNLIDGQGILDRKDMFAEATRQAMINGHQINETMSRLNGRL